MSKRKSQCTIAGSQKLKNRNCCSERDQESKKIKNSAIDRGGGGEFAKERTYGLFVAPFRMSSMLMFGMPGITISPGFCPA